MGSKKWWHRKAPVIFTRKQNNGVEKRREVQYFLK
jgi:hypothetical protein